MTRTSQPEALDLAQRPVGRVRETARCDTRGPKQDVADAGDETEKAKAQAEQAKAETKAAKSRSAVVADCAKAYVSAFGALFEGDTARDQAPAVREQLSDITAICKDELAGA